MIHFVRQRNIWYIFSGVLIGVSLTFVFLGGLRLGTDFTGGSLLQINFPDQQTPTVQEIEQVLNDAGFFNARVQSLGESGVAIRIKQLTEEEHQNVLKTLTQKYENAEEQAYAGIGPILGRELRQKAILAIIIVLLGIIFYISWAFRKSTGMLSGWAFGVNAILALIHDVCITTGLFAILGYFFHIEIDALFVTALLTVIGFSVHDTIVVYDRIREGLRRNPHEQLTFVIDRSINETLIRSINTNLTTILVLCALYFFGGVTLQYFILTLIVGITIGTYSSIFVASPLLLFWGRRR
jgi:preprotein translocase subunit SecF